jgi:murein DD-endopeptidase MepM/ murein hydrolase activator NlpD
MQTELTKLFENLTRRWEQANIYFLPDREIIFRTDGRLRHLKIDKKLQIVFACGIFFVSGWLVFSSFTYVINDALINVKNKDIIAARMAYRGLLSDVNDYQNKFSNLTTELGINHSLLLNLAEKNLTLQQNFKTARSKIEFNKSRNKTISETRLGLRNRLSDIESELKIMNKHNFSLKGNLSSVTTNLEIALSERNAAVSEGKTLSNTINKLKHDIVNIEKSEKAIITNVIQRTAKHIQDMKYVLKLTGIDIKKKNINVKIRKGIRTGQGGPFIALASNRKLEPTLINLNLIVNESKALELLMSRIPISAPLDYFSISSHFGRRLDPINKRWARHSGIDFGGVPGTSVFVTAPGTVTYSGRNGKYGRLVEVDHGQGFKTRYGHLQKILVKKGKKVNYRDRVGLMGSSGRSTGPHLHYEILVKGKRQNPWRFIKAGRFVYKRK